MQNNYTVCQVKPAPTECSNNYRSTPKEEECISEEPPLIPMYIMIPFEETSFEPPKKELSTKRIKSASLDDIQTPKVKLQTNDVQYPEMRSGILFTRCHCVHRDGLQDACPLSECQNQPKCLVKPWPSCIPAKYLQSRHPQQYPPSN